MTKEQFEKIFNYMFAQVEINCRIGSKKLMDIIWKVIKNKLYRGGDYTEDLFNSLVALYKHYYAIENVDTEKYLSTLKDVCKNILIIKANEYMASEDRLHNFMLVSKKTDIQPDLVCLMFMLKHIASIDDIVHERISLTQSQINEKFIDAINYCILLKAIMQEMEVKK